MKNFLKFLLLLLFCSISAQKVLPFDSLKLQNIQDVFADDYGNIYLYKKQDFSFTKYDSLGNQKGKLMFTLPYKIQSVQNLLSIPAFSENAQELKFFDQNLTEIEHVNFAQKFGFIKMAFAEDLQQIWLLEESSKRLLQYNFRDDKILNSYPLNIDFENIKDILVFNNVLYILKENQFSAYDFKGRKILEIPVESGKRLRRENNRILIITKNSIQELKEQKLETIIRSEDLEIVDKNSAANFGIKQNKLYLYQP